SLAFYPIEFIISLTFQAGFEDMFAIRGLFQGKRGQLHQPEWSDGKDGRVGETLRFAYDGADKLYRELTVGFSPPPAGARQNTVHFKIGLEAKESGRILVSLQLSESPEVETARPLPRPRIDRAPAEFSLRSSGEASLWQETEITSDSLLLNRVMDRSMRD